MSRRKGPPRGVKGCKRYTGLSDSDLSEDDTSLMQIFEAVLQQNARRRRAPHSNKKRQPPKKSRRSSSNITAGPSAEPIKKKASGVSQNSISCDSDEEKIDVRISETVASDHIKQIENKVNNFFKSHNLLSDDEDEKIPTSSKNATLKETKEFYELPDSDEELNTILKSTNSEKLTVTSTSPGPSGSKEGNVYTNKSDELMDIVDKILVCDDSTTDLTNNEPNENWMEMKNKAQDMLGSINNLLNEIDEKTKPQELKPSPEKAKPTCPICLEQLGGDIIMMTTICGHIFCKDCITQVAKTSKRCPTCRKQVNLKKIHAVYL